MTSRPLCPNKQLPVHRVASMAGGLGSRSVLSALNNDEWEVGGWQVWGVTDDVDVM